MNIKSGIQVWLAFKGPLVYEFMLIMFELEEDKLFKLKLKQIWTFASACYKIFTYHSLGSVKSDKHQVWLCEAFIQRARKCMSNEWHDPSKGSTKAIVAKSSPNFPPSIRFDFLGTQSQRKSLLWCWDDKITTLAYRVPWCPLPSQEPLHFSRFFDTFSHDAASTLDGPNLDLVQFSRPVVIRDVRIIPLGTKVQARCHFTHVWLSLCTKSVQYLYKICTKSLS